jgi:hypothetical protein
MALGHLLLRTTSIVEVTLLAVPPQRGPHTHITTHPTAPYYTHTCRPMLKARVREGERQGDHQRKCRVRAKRRRTESETMGKCLTPPAELSSSRLSLPVRYSPIPRPSFHLLSFSSFLFVILEISTQTSIVVVGSTPCCSG